MKIFNYSFFSTIFVVFIIVFNSETNAQFTANKHYVGPSVGFYFGESSLILGGNYEYGMELSDIGTVGFGGIVRYYSYDAGYWSYTEILIGAQGNYHFKLDNDKLDPWVGIMLAYDSGSVDYDGPSGIHYNEPSVGGFFLGAHGGFRYWFSPTMAVVGRVGFGSFSYSAFDVGVDFKL